MSPEIYKWVQEPIQSGWKHIFGRKKNLGFILYKFSDYTVHKAQYNFHIIHLPAVKSLLKRGEFGELRE